MNAKLMPVIMNIISQCRDIGVAIAKLSDLLATKVVDFAFIYALWSLGFIIEEP